MPPALTTGLALLVAALAAVGLTGPALLRAVRNEPDGMAAVITFALLGLGLFVGARLWPASSAPASLPDDPATATRVVKDVVKVSSPGTGPADVEATTRETTTETTYEYVTRTAAPPKHQAVVSGLGLALFLGMLCVAVRLGADSVGARERPLVTIDAAPGAAAATNATGAFPQGSVAVQVALKATGMTTRNDVLVQVLGLVDAPLSDPATVRTCETNQLRSESDEQPALPQGVDLLLWNRVGPQEDGSVDEGTTLHVPAGRYRAVCAWSAFSGDDAPPLEAQAAPAQRQDATERLAQSSAAYLQLAPPS